MSTRIPKAGIVLLCLIWSSFVMGAYFISHKPVAIQVFALLVNSIWTFLVTITLVINSCTVGRWFLKRFIPVVQNETSAIVLACGIGLGALGLTGFGLASIGASSFKILLGFQFLLLLLGILKGEVQGTVVQIRRALYEMKASALGVPAWMRWAAVIALTLTGFRTLLPPIEAFDALLYHLTVPSLWLRDGGLRAYDFPHYWFPGLVEGAYLWGLGLGSEQVTQQLHFIWALLTVVLIWEWARKLSDELTAWWSVMLLISMPSVLLLASWAYTDLALAFYATAMLFCLWKGMESSDTNWWKVAALSAGLSMGIKYTSFVLPVTAVLWIIFWTARLPRKLVQGLFDFSFISLLVASPWYLRNWIWMGNPFYPFVFGGRYWDSFRAAWFAGAGTGSGWDWEALVLLPVTLTLGNRDVNYFDGNIGPLFLFALPSTLAVLVSLRRYDLSKRIGFGAIGLFTGLSAGVWLLGYVATKNLWQTRLLIPALLPFAIPAAAGMTAIKKIDTRHLRISFIAAGLAALAIFTQLLDFSLGVISRNPFALATGITSRDEFFENYQPSYFSALQMIAKTPKDAKIYSLFEPRSYDASRDLQPDPILDNFSHDEFLHKTPDSILAAWRAAGYTHVLLNVRGANFIAEDAGNLSALDDTLLLLKFINRSPDGEYELYEILHP